MENIALSDIKANNSKTIIVNYFYQNREYIIKDWSCELLFYSTVDKEKHFFYPVTNNGKNIVFYLSEDDTSNLSHLATTQQLNHEIITNNRNTLNYEISLVKSNNIDERKIMEDDVKITLCQGQVLCLR